MSIARDTSATLIATNSKFKLYNALTTKHLVQYSLSLVLSTWHSWLISRMDSLEQAYNHVFTDLRDPRVDSWALMSSPWPTFAFCAFYYYIVRFAGVDFMKDRPAYSCKTAKLVYNLFQTLFSLWIFSRLCGFWLSGKYNWVCQPVDYSDSVDGLNAANIVWWYFFSKFTDFMDSFFMILCKKNNQLTSLHVIHHAMMPMTSWIFLK